jgi:Cu/Ag efflux pump CusA
VHLEFTGTAEASRQAQRELMFNVVLAGVGVVALLLIAFGNGRSTGLIIASAPFAMVGGILAIVLTGSSLSLGALVGFVTLFGVAARNAILLISHTEHLVADEALGWSLDTILRATRERTLPIVMTALVTALGLAPLAFQTGQAGREIQGPMALVILGGLVTSTLMSLFLLPALIWRYGRAPTADRSDPEPALPR